MVGGGPAGLLAALLLARGGVATVLVAPPAPEDHRTTGLLAGSVAILERAGIWPALLPVAAPMRAIRLIDDGGRRISGPEVVFRAAEIGLEAFGHNIANRDLVAALAEAVAAMPGLRRVTDTAAEIRIGVGGVTVRTGGGETLHGRLVVGADGRNSAVRAAAGIGVRRWGYDQAALVTTLRHARGHDDVALAGHAGVAPVPRERDLVHQLAVDLQRAHAVGDLCPRLDLRARGHDHHPAAVLDPAVGRQHGVDLGEHLRLQLVEPRQVAAHAARRVVLREPEGGRHARVERGRPSGCTGSRGATSGSRPGLAPSSG